MMRHAICTTLLLLLGLSASCGKDTSSRFAPVSGKITLDGEPLVGVKVVFVPKNYRGGANEVVPYSYATTDEDGNYKLRADGGKGGAVVGEHFVFISSAEYEFVDLEKLKREAEKAKKGLGKKKNEGQKGTTSKAEERNKSPKKSDQPVAPSAQPADSNQDPAKQKSKTESKESERPLLLDRVPFLGPVPPRPKNRRIVKKEEAILSQYNSKTKLEFTVKQGTGNQANFDLSRYPD